MDAGSLESLGAITGLVNDQQQKRSMAQAQLATLADQLSQSQSAQQGNSAFGGALLGSLDGGSQPEAPAPGQPSVPGAQRAPAQAGGLSIPGFLNALKTSRFAGNGQAMAAALQKFLPLMQQQQQQTRLNQSQQSLEDYRKAMSGVAQGKLAATTTAGGNALGDDDANRIADQYLAGDKSGLSGLGYGTIGSANRAKVQRAITQRAKDAGMSPGDITKALAQYQGEVSGAKTIGSYGAKLDLAGRAADAAADQALEASSRLPRGNFVPANQAIQAWQSNTSDPALSDLGFSLFTLANLYAKAINPQGVPREGDRNEAIKYLSTATSPQALATVIARLQKEITLERTATGQAKANIGGNPQANTPAAGAPAMTKPSANPASDFSHLWQ